MTYQVLAWKLGSPGTQNYPPLCTIAALHRLIDLLVTQDAADYITIRFLPAITNDQIALDFPE